MLSARRWGWFGGKLPAATWWGAGIGAVASLPAMALDPPNSLFQAVTGVTLTLAMLGGFVGALGALVTRDFRKWRELAHRDGAARVPLGVRACAVLNCLGSMLVLFSSACFLNGFMAASGFNPWTSDSTELPLGDLQGIAVDSAGHVYCGLQFYSRVQAYDERGRFLYGRFVDAGGGAFSLRTNAADQLEVTTVRTDMLYVFGPAGALISKTLLRNPGQFVMGEDACKGPDGSLYRVRGGLFPRITKTSARGIESDLVTMPHHRWLMMGPLPVWFGAPFGMLILVLAGLYRSRQ